MNGEARKKTKVFPAAAAAVDLRRVKKSAPEGEKMNEPTPYFLLPIHKKRRASPTPRTVVV